MLNVGTRLRLWALVVMGAVALLVGGCTSASAGAFRPSGPPRALPGAGVFPDVTGDEFEGMLVGQAGRVVVVNVWASWCAPCRTEAPLLQEAASAYPDVTFVGVDSKDSRSAALDFIEEFGIEYANIFDGTGEVRQRLGLRGFPTTYIFSVDGSLRASVVGGISEQRLAAQIEDARRG